MEAVKLKINPTILYVEDNELNQLVIRKMLNALGYEQVLIAGDANAALALLEDPATQPDLILMDLGLPGMDGIALAQTIRHSQLQAKNVPIIAVTGNEEVEAKVKSFAAGMNDFLVKPVEKVQLGLKLERFFSGKK
jgi:CheY-like chemotaxis protein